jgi:ubiquinone/menaquinone biosynthesis C-methylase UbiE
MHLKLTSIPSAHVTVARPSRMASALHLSRILVCPLVLAFALGQSQPVSAQLAAKSADAWIKTLDSSNRVARLKIDETIARLKIKPGEVIADIGAGSGVFCGPLAKAASPGGKVYAVDIDQGLIDHIASRAKELRVTNIQTVLGKFTDPNLPGVDVDLAFINDVLHHIEDRAGYLKSLARYLKPSGRIAVIDFYPDLGGHKNEPALQITKDQTAAWMNAIGFKPVEEFALFNDKWFVVYSR